MFRTWSIGPMFRTWSIGPVLRCRDSDPKPLARARSIESHLLASEKLEGEWRVERFNHWAVGWVEHLTFRVLDDAGKPTAIFRRLRPMLYRWGFLKK